MSDDTDARLTRLLGGPALAVLRQRLRRRYERAAPGSTVTGFRLGQLTEAEHRALAALLGRPSRGAGSLVVDAPAIDAALHRAGIAGSLREALERLDGPIINLAEQRDHLQAHWHQVLSACENADLRALLAMPTGLGLLKRLCGEQAGSASALLDRAQAVLHQLPAHGLTRAQLAADVLGDAHALDPGCAVATLVLAALRRRAEPTLELDPAPADDALEAVPSTTRELWAGAGVLVNELARPALCLNLPVRPGLAMLLPSGEPAYLSLRTLLRSPPRWDVAGRSVFVCENPNLLAIAADRLGPACAPLVCTDGMPAAAQRTLLMLLRQAGALLRYHGDFDWPGLRIGNHVLQANGAVPWRFGTADYIAAAAAAPRPGRRLQGSETEALWDAGVARAMRDADLAVDEEAVAGALLADLADD